MRQSIATLLNLLTRLIIAASVAFGTIAQAADLYVSNYNLPGGIYKYDQTGANLGAFAPELGNRGLAFDISGNLFVAYEGEGNGFIRKYSPTGTDLGMFANLGLGSSPTDLVFDTAGNVLVADGPIRKFGPTGTDLGIFANTPGATDLAFDASGNLFVVDAFNYAIRKFGPTGADLGTFLEYPQSQMQPYGIVFDSSGNLYVSNADYGLEQFTIHKFGPTGVDLGVFASTGLDEPRGLAFDDSGNLYVANSSGATIRKFGPTGTDLGIFATGPSSGSQPLYLAFAPVPEPSAFALAALGMLGLAAWGWRRKR